MKTLFRSNLLNALWILTLANAMDILTSVLGSHRGLMETNPMARNADMSFNLLHGVVIKILYTAFYFLVGVLGYGLFRRYDRRLAEAVAMLPMLACAWLVMGAVLHNAVITGLGGWYVPDLSQIFR